MKRLVLVLFSALLINGCNDSNGKEHARPQPVSDDKGGVNLKVVTISDKLRKELGLEPRDMLVAVTDNGNILYTSEKFTVIGDQPVLTPNKKEKPKLENFITIVQTSNSPTCSYYYDGFGNRKTYPRPDCPHP